LSKMDLECIAQAIRARHWGLLSSVAVALLRGLDGLADRVACEAQQQAQTLALDPRLVTLWASRYGLKIAGKMAVEDVWGLVRLLVAVLRLAGAPMEGVHLPGCCPDVTLDATRSIEGKEEARSLLHELVLGGLGLSPSMAVTVYNLLVLWREDRVVIQRLVDVDALIGSVESNGEAADRLRYVWKGTVSGKAGSSANWDSWVALQQLNQVVDEEIWVMPPVGALPMPCEAMVLVGKSIIPVVRRKEGDLCTLVLEAYRTKDVELWNQLKSVPAMASVARLNAVVAKAVSATATLSDIEQCIDRHAEHLGQEHADVAERQQRYLFSLLLDRLDRRTDEVTESTLQLLERQQDVLLVPLARAALALGDGNKAISYAVRAVKQQDSAVARLVLAEALFKQEYFGFAREHLGLVHPDSEVQLAARFHCLHVEVALAFKDIPAAMRHLPLLASPPISLATRVVEMLLEHGHLSDAVSLWIAHRGMDGDPMQLVLSPQASAMDRRIWSEWVQRAMQLQE